VRRVPSSARPLGSVQSGLVLSAETIRILKRVALHGRPRRDAAAVNREYDCGDWSRLLEQKPWTQSATLDQFLIDVGPGERVAKIANRLVRIPNAEYYRFRAETLRALLATYAGDEKRLAEIGCGYGVNLFSLHSVGLWDRLMGFDISPAGLQAGTEIAKYYGLGDRIEFRRLDLLDRHAAEWAHLRGATAFTYYCFEQLTHSTLPALENLSAAGVRRVIHIEATPELWSAWRPQDAVSRLYAWSRDYQSTLLTVLRRLEREKRVRLLDVQRLYYAPAVRHDPTLICWEPTAR
jgi:SAM-dependent methyltransferase